MNDLRQDIQKLATSLGIDLSKFGAASPTKLFQESLILATDIIDKSIDMGVIEQNPMTATNFRSLLGLCCIVGYNAADLLKGSVGEVKISTDSDKTLVINNGAQLFSPAGVPYYIDMTHNQVVLADKLLVGESKSYDGTFRVRQGELKDVNFTFSGEPYEAFVLDADDIVDTSSIKVYVNGVVKTTSLSVTSGADFAIHINAFGQTELISLKHSVAGDTLKVTYADCIGNDGDNLSWHGSSLESKELQKNNESNLSISIKGHTPPLGGTDKILLSKLLRTYVTTGSTTNLIGSTEQLMQYLKRFTQYTMSVSKKYKYQVTVSICRSIDKLIGQNDNNYWKAVKQVQMHQSDDDDIFQFKSMQNILDTDFANIVHFVPAKIVNIAAQLYVRMLNPNKEILFDTVAEWAMRCQKIRKFEMVELETMIDAIPDVEQCRGRFIGSKAYNTITDSNGQVTLVPSKYLDETYMMMKPASDDEIMLLDTIIIVLNNVRYSIRISGKGIEGFDYGFDMTFTVAG